MYVIFYPCPDSIGVWVFLPSPRYQKLDSMSNASNVLSFFPTHRSNIPILHYYSIFHHSIIPLFHYSTFPVFHYSNISEVFIDSL